MKYNKIKRLIKNKQAKWFVYEPGRTNARIFTNYSTAVFYRDLKNTNSNKYKIKLELNHNI